MSNSPKTYNIDDLRYLMARLRDPADGCPWDLKQDWDDLVPLTLEEVYEVVDAIDHQDWRHVSEELGDLLFHILFYSHLASEARHFDFDQVVQGIVEKLLRRHPHVFPDGTLSSRASEQAPDEQAIKGAWERIKQQEKADSGRSVQHTSRLDDIPLALPALKRAIKLQKRAAQVGYDWSDPTEVFGVIRDELSELEAAYTQGYQAEVAEELGDVLFSVANLARKLHIDAERAADKANQKFSRRFQWVEQTIRQEGLDWSALSASALDGLWNRAKRATADPDPSKRDQRGRARP